jgi:hypothetical protein
METGYAVPRRIEQLAGKPACKQSRILNAIDQGDPKAAEALLPLVYQGLRKLAAQNLLQENAGQTLQAPRRILCARVVRSGNGRARGDVAAVANAGRG